MISFNVNFHEKFYKCFNILFLLSYNLKIHLIWPNLRKGKVFVFCESIKDRIAKVVTGKLCCITKKFVLKLRKETFKKFLYCRDGRSDFRNSIMS